MIASAAIALSGALAQSDRVAVAASNLANQRSTGALPVAGGAPPAGKTAAYQPLTTATVAQPGGGVITGFRPVAPAVLPESDPTSPNANAQGLVAVLKVTDEMRRQALNLTA